MAVEIAIVAAITSAIIQGLKSTPLVGFIKNWAFILALLISVGLTFSPLVELTYLEGLIAGLSAMGLYDSVKQTSRAL